MTLGLDERASQRIKARRRDANEVSNTSSAEIAQRLRKLMTE
ncbi:hypothetical protein HMPREF9999_00689 [Alloprevotella sp. oral taxon 473 str. F0040]|nr:hypothetical protein HMPREF9999_00689 [Alloprevotella sp. oral taxon 473 str. F0040]